MHVTGVKAMRIDAIKHNLKWNTWAGDKYRKFMTWIGLKMLSNGRKLIKRGMVRCSWCGAHPGFSSTSSSYGVRCSSLERDCTSMPDA